MSTNPWLCDIDPVAVDLAVGGYGKPPRLNHCERIEAVRRLRDQGVSITQTAHRLGIPTRYVERYRAQLKEGAA